MTEKWLPIDGYSLGYEVSNLGRVRRIGGAILRPEVMKHNYRRVTLRHPRKRWCIHRLVLHVFVGPRPVGHETNHLDGNPSNNRLENLEYVTPKQNIAYSYQVLLRKPAHKGEKTHFSKLTDGDVNQIRKLRQQGNTYAAIAERFNTKQANIWHICTGRTWKHLL